MSTLAVFLVLAGGAAYAARVGKKSVGAPQLKANAVTTAKIKANAITTRKIKRNAVSNAKIKDGAVESLKLADGSVAGRDIARSTVTAENLDLETMPFGRVVHRASGSAIVALGGDGSTTVYPLGGAAYTQAADESDSFLGAVDVRFSSSCSPPRQVTAFLALDPADPEMPGGDELVAAGAYTEGSGGGTVTARVELSPNATRFEPGTPRTRHLSLSMQALCAGGTGNVDALAGAANVIGTR